MWAQWRLAWLLARRFRRGRERSRFLSFISASSTAGIALGCMVFITGLSVMNGFGQVLEERFLKLVPHVEFRAVEGALKYPESLFELAEQHPQVQAARANIRTQALVQQGREFIGVQVNGIDPSQDHAIAAYMVAQAWQDLKQLNTVVLGSGLAQQLNAKVGDKIRLVVAAERGFQAPKRVALEVVGVFRFGGQVDHQMAYVNLATARNLIGLSQGFTGVELEVTDLFAAERIANEIGYQLRDYVYLDHWMRAQGHLYRDIQMVRVVMYLVLILVLAVACFNIVSSLVMAVKEKQASIAILKTMGATDRQVRFAFMYQGMLNGVIGVFWGTLLAVITAPNLSAWIGALESLLGIKVLSGDIYFIDFLPSQLYWGDVLITVVVALTLSILATLYPAHKAAAIAPARALH